MPEYMSVSEAAARWNVSVRQVQRLVAAGRVIGATKYGRDYLIPRDAQKPSDSRNTKKQQQIKSTIEDNLAHIAEIAVTWPTLPWSNPDILVSSIPDEPYYFYRLFVEGWIAYLRGDFEKTKTNYSLIENEAVKLWASPLTISAAVGTGDYQLYKEIEIFCKSMIEKDIGENVTAVASWTLAAVSVDMFIVSMIPEWLKAGDFSHLPTHYRNEAFFYRAHYLYFIKEYKAAYDIAYTALNFFPRDKGMSSANIQLRFICAMTCCSLGRLDDAKEYLLELMQDCLPNGIVTPFSEHLLDLGGLVERFLEMYYPKYYDIVVQQSKSTILNWRIFHNLYAKDNISLVLEPREYQMALAAARGDSDTSIAKQFNLATGTVRNYMQTIYEKLMIEEKPRRKELLKYLW